MHVLYNVELLSLLLLNCLLERRVRWKGRLGGKSLPSNHG